MRQNTRDAIARYTSRRPSPASVQGTAIWTDGEAIYSYGTCLFGPLPGVRLANAVGSRVFNATRYSATRYSPTTGCHQRALREWLGERHPGLVVVDDAPRGVTPAELARLAYCHLTSAQRAAA